MPGDLKRAEELKRAKGAGLDERGVSLDGSTLHSSSASTIGGSSHKRIASYDETTDGEERNSGGVFFDAEVAEKERDAWRTD